MDRLTFVLMCYVIPMSYGAIPGTFFWKPRLGLDLAVPTTESQMFVQEANEENIAKGLVILIDGYEAGMTIVGFASGVSNAQTYPHLNPLAPHFYTNAYRWALRHLSLMPFWLGGKRGGYCDTHKLWKRRFFYLEEFIPKWMRYLFPYIKEDEWDKEIEHFRLYRKYAEAPFAKNYVYPENPFKNFTRHYPSESKASVTLDSSLS